MRDHSNIPSITSIDSDLFNYYSRYLSSIHYSILSSLNYKLSRLTRHNRYSPSPCIHYQSLLPHFISKVTHVCATVPQLPYYYLPNANAIQFNTGALFIRLDSVHFHHCQSIWSQLKQNTPHSVCPAIVAFRCNEHIGVRRAVRFIMPKWRKQTRLHNPGMHAECASANIWWT